MDISTKNRMEEIRNKIQNSTYEELMNTKIIEEDKAIESGIGDLTIYYVPKEYLHDLQLTLNETIQLRRSKKEIDNQRRRREDDEAIEWGSSRYHDYGNFEKRPETPEQRARRLKAESKMREAKKRIEKRNIKNKPNNKRKIKKSKENRGKKIRTVLISLGLGTIATIGAFQGISAIQADTNDYNNTATTVVDLDENQISKKAEEELKQKLADAIGVDPEEISFSVSRPDSSTTITEINTQNENFRRVEDGRGINEGNMPGDISRLITEMKNVHSREDAIRVLSKIENKSISYKDGKLEGNRQTEREGEER